MVGVLFDLFLENGEVNDVVQGVQSLGTLFSYLVQLYSRLLNNLSTPRKTTQQHAAMAKGRHPVKFVRGRDSGGVFAMHRSYTRLL